MSCGDRRKDEHAFGKRTAGQGRRPRRGRTRPRWLVLLSLSLFVFLLPIASYVAALSAIKDELGLNNAGAERSFRRTSRGMRRRRSSWCR